MLLAPLRGARFYPPATALLAILPANHPLELEPEPENPYDPNAVRVLLDTTTLNSLPGDVLDELELRLSGFGTNLEELKREVKFKIGHVGKEFCLQILPHISDIDAKFITSTNPKDPFALKLSLKQVEKQESDISCASK